VLNAEKFIIVMRLIRRMLRIFAVYRFFVYVPVIIRENAAEALKCVRFKKSQRR